MPGCEVMYLCMTAPSLNPFFVNSYSALFSKQVPEEGGRTKAKYGDLDFGSSGAESKRFGFAGSSRSAFFVGSTWTMPLTRDG